MLIVDRGSMFYNKSQEEWFFFDIDVKGGENSRREDLNACDLNACGLLCCHQC
jgi:hypothetical protein